MAQTTVVGVFESVAAAEHAKAQLTAFGVAAERIALSANLTDDGIAAEAPGQSYEHQSYAGSDSADTRRARYGTAVRTGACLLSVSGETGPERRQLAELLRREGARVTMLRP